MLLSAIEAMIGVYWRSFTFVAFYGVHCVKKTVKTRSSVLNIGGLGDYPQKRWISVWKLAGIGA